MFGLDEYIAGVSDGTSLLLVSAVAILLGLRHAADPDHITAVTTLIASSRERTAATARRLGVAWGAGHALTLFALGVPIVLFEAYLPDAAQQSAEAVIGVLIVALAVWLLVRWRRGAFHVHAHEHGALAHVHAHSHVQAQGHEHAHRTPLQAFGIGLLHGVGGSAGVGILIVAAVETKTLAMVALLLLAIFTAVSMTVLTTGFGVTLARAHARGTLRWAAPALGIGSLAFGCWYALGALEVVPYVF